MWMARERGVTTFLFVRKAVRHDKCGGICRQMLIRHNTANEALLVLFANKSIRDGSEAYCLAVTNNKYKHEHQSRRKRDSHNEHKLLYLNRLLRSRVPEKSKCCTE